MQVKFSQNSWEEYISWQPEDKKIVMKINELLKDIQRTPNIGIGNPKPLKYDLSGYWSRRIDKEHRLVYQVINEEIFVYSCRYHYDK